MRPFLDKFVCTQVQIFHRSLSAFQVCGCTGLALAVLLSLSLALRLGFSPWVMTALVLAAAPTFFALVLATKIITGEERIIYYHHEIAVVTVAAVLLWLMRQPILPYLDVVILGIGMFLFCGRLGCLMVGCCHGRPHRWGVCYRDAHAAAGFTPYLIGVRLFPIQLVESLWALCIVVVGVAFVLRGHQPGAALAWYVVAYDLGRFCFEFMRGDPDRRYLWGFSEAQWTSVILLCGVVWGESSGILPYSAWHVGAGVCLLLAMAAIAVSRRIGMNVDYRILRADHLKELAEAVEKASRVTTETSIAPRSEHHPAAQVWRTSLGIRISGGDIRTSDISIFHYTLSCSNGAMKRETAGKLAVVIRQLRHAFSAVEIMEGNRNVFHLLVHPPAENIRER